MLSRTLAPVLLVAVLWVGMSTATTYYVQWLERSHQQFFADNIVSIRAAGEDWLTTLRRAIDVLAPAPTPYLSAVTDEPESAAQRALRHLGVDLRQRDVRGQSRRMLVDAGNVGLALDAHWRAISFVMLRRIVGECGSRKSDFFRREEPR